MGGWGGVGGEARRRKKIGGRGKKNSHLDGKKTLTSTEKKLSPRRKKNSLEILPPPKKKSKQYITNHWLLQYGFSIGIGDTVADARTMAIISRTIEGAEAEVKRLTQKLQARELEAQPGRSMMESFENQVNQVLNKARDDAGRQAQASLKDTNNVVRMVTAGSKGSFINISQMIACVGKLFFFLLFLVEFFSFALKGLGAGPATFLSFFFFLDICRRCSSSLIAVSFLRRRVRRGEREEEREKKEKKS